MQYSLMIITKHSILYELFCPHFFLLNMGQRGGERGDEEEGRRGWVGTGSWWCDGVGEIGGQVRRCYGNRLIGKNVSSCGARRGREKESEK